ncbi:hypothetical protein CCR85_03830 [Rhodothalassium salexigens]|nr:hypothetical protein [Rhodothalassium salexigens]MBK5920096.1 hypothetical protein [Rhodothalassium salexigens]
MDLGVAVKPRVFVRKFHHWSSVIVAVPVIIMTVTGILLLLKKDIAWIQPSSQRGTAVGVPTQSLDTLFAAAAGVERAGLDHWNALDRVDIKPGKGIVKFIGENNWEVQVDTHSGEVLAVAYRRSGIIEALHDGTFFADWVKLYVFLPSGVILLLLWGTGLYLFFLTQNQRNRKARAPKPARRPITDRPD